MPTRYSPAQKQEALRLLDLYDNKLFTVSQLTGIPTSTLHDWRKQRAVENPDSAGQKNIPLPENIRPDGEPPSHPDYPDAELIQDGDLQYWRLPSDEVFAHLSAEERENLAHLREPDEPEPPPAETPPHAEPAIGIPGKTYPYPLEEDPTDTDANLEDFRRLRAVLMRHAQNLAANLNPDDPDINRRSLALSRILDRIHQLDNMLPSLMPEQILRHEFVYDGMVHDKAPWKRTEEDLIAQLEIVRKRKADEARKCAIQASIDISE